MKIVLLLCVSLSLASESTQQNVDWVNESLKKTLMTNYNSNTLPANSKALRVGLDLVVTHINIIEKQSLLETYGFLELVSS